MSMHMPRRAMVACLAIFAATSACTIDFSGNMEPQQRGLQDDDGVVGDEPVGDFGDD